MKNSGMLQKVAYVSGSNGSGDTDSNSNRNMNSNISNVSNSGEVMSKRDNEDQIQSSTLISSWW